MAASALGNIDIKVTPEELLSKSQEVSNNIQVIKSHFDELQAVFSKTEWYWIGESGGVHRKAYVDLHKGIESLIGKLSEHPKDLVEIAQRYTDVELKIEEVANELAGDVLL